MGSRLCFKGFHLARYDARLGAGDPSGFACAGLLRSVVFYATKGEGRSFMHRYLKKKGKQFIR